jgi:hypothetical protein
VALVILLGVVGGAHAQGSRKDDIVFGPSGHPIAGATVRVCQATATGSPCTPLATLYTNATLTTTSANPLQADGIGNYHFYAPAGRYLIQITGPGLTGTMSYPDVILAPDVSSTSSGNDISAFGLTLGGNLSVAGNATITGTLTTSNFSPGSFSPSSLMVGGNASVAGPRPYIDVTAPPYNADPTAASDATAAIQAAITAACGYSVASHGRPSVFIPSGKYSITQTQTGTSTTAPIFTICGGLHIFSYGSLSTTSQGANPPEGAVLYVNGGASPNGAPVFLISNSGDGSGPNSDVNNTFENIAINGYNQAIWIQTSGNVRLEDVDLTSQVTGQTDNTPLKISNSIWVWINNSQFNSGSPTVPTMIMSGEAPLTGEQNIVGLLFMRDVNTFGGGFDYIQRSASVASLPGNWSFRNVTQENSSLPFLNVTESTPGNLAGIANILMDNSQQADAPDGGNPMVNLNVATGYMQNPVLINSWSQLPNAVGIRVQSGTLRDYYTIGNGGSVVGPSGPISTGTMQQVDENGTDETSPVSGYLSASNSLPCAGFFGGCVNGVIAHRWFMNGNSLSTLGLDASTGVLFGNGSLHGYSSSVTQTALGDTDFQTAALLPPSGFSGSATTGGSLSAATYYGVIWATSGGSLSNCAVSTFYHLSTLAYATGIGISGSNNAVNFTWTVPQSTPTAVGGYCLYVSTTNPGFDGQVNSAIFVSSGSTSFLYTGQTQGAVGTVWPVSEMVSQHRFTYNSLGVNTTTPAYNLDVNGTAAVNALNGVQKAERFAGADAGLQINSCLTTASTTSGVCDARGLTGTYTGTHHISIPAHTSLLWCQGKLTISDTGTNDAVELAGDGAAMYGCGESGSGTVPRPQTSGYIACGIAGCTDVDNPNSGTANVDWIHIEKMYLAANGASSTVINMTSVGHTDIENNRFVLGTGGGSYGVYGNTSTGNEDSTNSLIKHNEFDAASQNDTCLYLAGVFNSIKVEQNSCYLPAENTGTIGFALAKDSNGNYPDNDEFDANDCEAATTSFGQICFNLVGAQNVQIGPTNRCENVYNCIQFPSDGSAVGNHMIDPYLSLSVNTMVKPNEPAAAQQAMDNTGTNWQPSFHYGLSDLGGTNLLSNPGLEGWANSTTLYDWSGASGTSINQAGSGIYAQQQSASTPTDSTTQGSYSAKIGDNATAGLGIHSGCIQADPTMNYTLAFRVASTSTSAKFRPGFRFYSDPNCTEADRITSVSTNARVLQPAYYAGTSALAGTGANWQSTNASLTYNNGITCNCDVTGADWNVAAANTWTPTRNFAITFRVPNAFSSSSTTAQSMRVFILENTAANPNQIFVDDIALSQGPVNTRVPHSSAVTENGACVGCGINTVSSYSMGTVTAGNAPGGANQVDVSVIYLPDVTFSHITVDVSTLDSNTGDFYSWAITDTAGNVKCSMSSAVNLTATGTDQQSCSQGTVTLANGNYIFAFTGSATTAKIAYSGTAPLALSSAVSTSTSSSGAMAFPIGMPTAGQTFSSYGLPTILLN